MGFFSGIRRRIKKIIPKEIRPALPFIAAMAPIPGIGGLASRGLADQFLKASITKGLSDDEADLKDILRTGAIAAAPQAIGKGLGSVGENYFASKGTDSGIFKALTGAEKALSPGGGFKQTAKIVGGQAATDFGIKQAELNEKALEQYNADLLARGIRDKTERRSAIFNIFTGAGYDEDEVNVMLDKYGYADGGRVNYEEGGATEGLQAQIKMMRDAGMSEEDIIDFIQAMPKKKGEKEDEEEKINEITENIVKQLPTLIDKKIDLFSSKVNQDLNGI